MARTRLRRLTVGQDRYLWSLRHAHDDQLQDCRDVLRIRQEGSRGALAAVFRGNPDFGYTWAFTLHEGGASINLNEPGIVRAVLDAALARSWEPMSANTFELDGWQLGISIDGVKPNR